MNINLSVSAAPGISNYLIVAVYPSTTPTVVAAFEVLPRPLVAAVNVTFTGLDPVTHQVIIWENTVAEPGGTIRHDFFFDPEFAQSTIEVRDDLFLTVGAGAGNPVAGTSEFNRADLADWEYTVERRGFGSMEPEVDVQITNNGETITLIKSDGVVDDVFGEGEIFILHFEPKVIGSTPIEQLNSGRVFSGTEIITVSRTLVAADAGKAFKIVGDNNTLTITLPSLAAFPANRHMAFISQGGNHEAATLQAAGADTFEFLGGTPQQIVLGKCERLWIYSDGTAWIVTVADGNWKNIGEVFQSYKTNELNAVYANGELLLRAQYPRLWEWVQTLDASMLVTDANWNNVVLNNKGRYSQGTDSTNFRVPLLYTPGFVRGVNSASRKAGSYESEMIGPHSHEYKRPRTDIVGTQYETPNKMRGGNDRGLYTGDTVSTANNSGTENRPANVGVYLLIRV